MYTIPRPKYILPYQWTKVASGFRSLHISTENGLLAGDDIVFKVFQTQSIYDFSICSANMPRQTISVSEHYLSFANPQNGWEVANNQQNYVYNSDEPCV